ncbi:hypothetical protein IPM19_01195 [bacterium]|nr:MAG: hypothetical protein IPM19_01195 [bacterium]
MNTGPWRSINSINIMLSGSTAFLNQILTEIQIELAEQACDKSIELFRYRTAEFLINNPRLEKKISELTPGQKESLDELLAGYGKSLGCIMELDAAEIGTKTNCSMRFGFPNPSRISLLAEMMIVTSKSILLRKYSSSHGYDCTGVI